MVARAKGGVSLMIWCIWYVMECYRAVYLTNVLLPHGHMRPISGGLRGQKKLLSIAQLNLDGFIVH